MSSSTVSSCFKLSSKPFSSSRQSQVSHRTDENDNNDKNTSPEFDAVIQVDSVAFSHNRLHTATREPHDVMLPPPARALLILAVAAALPLATVTGYIPPWHPHEFPVVPTYPSLENMSQAPTHHRGDFVIDERYSPGSLSTWAHVFRDASRQGWGQPTKCTVIHTRQWRLR